MLFAVKDSRFLYQFYSDRSEVRLELWDNETKRMLSQTAVPFAVWQLLNNQRDIYMEQHMDKIEITDNQLGYFPLADRVASDAGYNITDELELFDGLLHQVDTGSSQHRYEWEEAGTSENPIVIDDDESYAENIPPVGYATPHLERSVSRQLFTNRQPEPEVDLADILGL